MTSAFVSFVVVEVCDGRVMPLCHEMLGLARDLAGVDAGGVHACVLGSDLDGVADELIAQGADQVHLIDAPCLATYQSDAWLPDLAAAVGRVCPDAVFVGHSAVGVDLAPRLAFRLGTTVATGCNHARIEQGKLLVTRPCYGGKAEEVVSFRTSPAVVTVKPSCFTALAGGTDRRGKLSRFPSVLDPESVRTRVREARRTPGDAARLETAKTIVAGGGGMQGPQGFVLAGRLAELLGGAVGASRVACDLGWCPRSWQIGLSGWTVAPELYVAIGISGAGQHMAGCSNSKTIVAINTDRDAPIFKYARYGIVGDCHELMPALVKQIEATRK